MRITGPLFAIALIGCTTSAPSSDAPSPTEARPQSTPPAQPPPPPAPKQPTIAEMLADASSLEHALALTRPAMEDTTDEHSRGMLMLAFWASRRLKLSDVQVAKNETSFKRVMKDSDAERGKRLCISGKIIQIAKQDVGTEDALFEGLLLTSGWEIVSFAAARSTGELVQRSRARFCGVVTGRYDYSNSGGGTGHAIDVVGVFDLPENRDEMAVTAQ